jgi:uracil-DNA glycosylase family 4
MNEITRANFEEWMRYADDLGLSPFFHDRAGAQSGAALIAETVVAEIVATEISVAESVETPPPMPKTKIEIPKIPQAAASRPFAAPPAAPPVILPVVSGPSLFDATDKIEGDTLERIRKDLGECTRCRLHERRHSIVFGTGNPSARLVFVGEGPGADEDAQGLPFVGRAGKLLTQMIEAMGLKREDVYICNVVKCRPPENRQPEKDEVATCSPYLMRQIDAIRPEVIVCLGSVAAQTMLSTNQGISKFRGQWLEFRGTRLLATYHPAYLLRNPPAKSEVWKDLQKVMAVLGLQPKKPASPR